MRSEAEGVGIVCGGGVRVDAGGRRRGICGGVCSNLKDDGAEGMLRGQYNGGTTTPGEWR